jgi:hypothetical protein
MEIFEKSTYDPVKSNKLALEPTHTGQNASRPTQVHYCEKHSQIGHCLLEVFRQTIRFGQTIVDILDSKELQAVYKSK